MEAKPETYSGQKMDLDSSQSAHIVISQTSDLINRQKSQRRSLRSLVTMGPIGPKYSEHTLKSMGDQNELELELSNASQEERTSKPEAHKEITIVDKDLTNNIHRLTQLLVNKMEPTGENDLQLLKLFGKERKKYKSLILSLNKQTDEHEARSYLSLINHNYDGIMKDLDRENRRKKLMSDSAKSSMIYRDDNLQDDNGEYELRNDLNEEYIELLRAKWSLYFAQMAKTPIEQKLENQRKQKEAELTALRAERKRIRLEKQHKMKQHHPRPITQLYTAPRLTHRMRQVIEERANAAKARVQSLNSTNAQVDDSKTTLVKGVIKTSIPISPSENLCFANIVHEMMSRNRCCDKSHSK
ncbi:uncharacterized protein LOC26528954 isoform X2 [Drosophila willistoni]|nr:uncharacterized protein LOC26528954 isoform X2 [Drosophila willistoni]